MSDTLRPSRVCTPLAVVSLMLAVSLLGLWLASFRWRGTYRFAPSVPRPTEASPMVGRAGEWRYQWGVSFGGGAFQVLRMHVGVNEVRPAGWTGDGGPYELSRGPRLPAAADFRLLGFRYFDSPRTYSTSGAVQYWSWGFRYVTIPGWLPVLLPGAPAAWWLLHRRTQSRRVRDGRCLACGYDLRATPDKCPECGAVPGHRFANNRVARHDRHPTLSREPTCQLSQANAVVPED